MSEKKPTKKWSEMNKAERIGGIIGLAIAVIIGTTIVGSVVSAVGTAISSHPTESSATQKSSQVTTYKNVTTTVAIPFSKTSQNDATRASGTSTITTAGVDGVKTQTFRVTYVDDIETTRNLVSEEVTTQPIAEVTSVGTYVAPKVTVQTGCTNGSYVNSAGNTVCSPEASSSAPAGATAQCSDGTYSFSQSRSGTCSHHGGVATWL
jgi:cytoskeletal protein RodZ